MPVGRYNVYHGVHVTIDFELDRHGIKEIAVNPEIIRVLATIAIDHAKPFAEAISADFADTGNYLRSFRVENTIVHGIPAGWPMTRAAARLVNISDHAVLVEVGSKNNPAHHVLLKTLEYMVATGVLTRRHKG